MPQVIEKPEYSIESWELMEIYHWLHTQEVRGSSPCAPTIFTHKPCSTRRVTGPESSGETSSVKASGGSGTPALGGLGSPTGRLPFGNLPGSLR